MRPQHITAENIPFLRNLDDAQVSFNEAAAYHCGKRPCRRGRATSATGFNEAAAYHCGKPAAAIEEKPARRLASMRPQHITAENPHADSEERRPEAASMRPQHITAENPVFSGAAGTAALLQ